MKRRGQGAHPISDSIDPRCGLCAAAIILSAVVFYRGRRSRLNYIDFAIDKTEAQFDAFYSRCRIVDPNFKTRL